MSYISKILRLAKPDNTERDETRANIADMWRHGQTGEVPVSRTGYLIVREGDRPGLTSPEVIEAESESELMDLLDIEMGIVPQTSMEDSTLSQPQPKAEAEKELRVIPLVTKDEDYNFISVSDWMGFGLQPS